MAALEGQMRLTIGAKLRPKDIRACGYRTATAFRPIPLPENFVAAALQCQTRHQRSSFTCRADAQQAVRPPNEPFPMDVPDNEEKQRIRKKTNVLMDILHAGEKLDAVIEANAAEIDEEMIDLLERRTKVAASMGEKEDSMRGLVLLKKRLTMEVERRKATPTQRLLDGLIELLSPEDGVHPLEQEEEVERILRWAFQPPQMPHVDIFATAARIAQGEEVETPKMDDDGHVPQHVFVWETQQLLTEATKNAHTLHKRVQRGNLGKYDAAYRHALQTKQEVLKQVSTVLSIAKRI